MIKYSVKKNGIVTNSWTSEFADETHYEPCFGLPERPELDAEGNPTGVILPAEYTIEIEDITAQVEQQKINEESLAYLASTDWMILRHLRQKALNQQTKLSEEEFIQLEKNRSEAANKVVR